MRKQILFILPIFLLAFTMAIYAGETITVEHNLGTDNLVYTIVDNSTIIPELNITINSTHITIFFPYDIPVDNFKLIFIEEQTNEVIIEVPVEKVVYRGGGGTRTITEEVNNTIYLNDTRYYPVESECPSCSEDNTEVPEETEQSKLNKSFLAIVTVIIGFILWLIFRKKETNKFNTDKKEDLNE